MKSRGIAVTRPSQQSCIKQGIIHTDLEAEVSSDLTTNQMSE